ncbi:hypothetical protein [Nonomuraea dietziae]|uniref:hypothetical protein n=1 Tax=Nonomuraea dietziae TaxID=65515 RepID=UPI0033E11067
MRPGRASIRQEERATWGYVSRRSARERAPQLTWTLRQAKKVARHPAWGRVPDAAPGSEVHTRPAPPTIVSTL